MVIIIIFYIILKIIFFFLGARKSSEVPAEASKVPQNPSYNVKWICLSIIVVGGIVACAYMFGIEQGQSDKPTDTPSRNKKPDSPTKKPQKANTFASITNDFDKTISKELNKAQKLLDKEKVEESLRKFEDLVQRYPKSPRASYGLAQSLDKLAEKQRSNQLLQQCIDAYEGVASVPDCPVELKRLALLKAAERWGFYGRSHQAARVLQQLSHHIPNDAEILNELGVQYLMGGRNKEAEEVFRKVLTISTVGLLWLIVKRNRKMLQ